MKPLTAENILEQRRAELVRLPVPEWDGDVYVRPLTSQQAEYVSDALTVPEDKQHARDNGGLRAIVGAWAICDEQGKRLFSDDKSKQLADMPSAGLLRVWRKVMEITKMSDKAVEEAEGN